MKRLVAAICFSLAALVAFDLFGAEPEGSTAKWTTDASALTTRRADLIFIGDNHRELFRVQQDGKVILAKDVHPDEASKAFWKLVQQYGIARCPEAKP